MGTTSAAEFAARAQEAMDVIEAEAKHRTDFTALLKSHVAPTTTVTVGPTGNFKTLQEAVNAIRYRIMKNVLTIKLQDGRHRMTGCLFEHIKGNVILYGTKGKCEIEWIADANKRSHGLIIRNANVAIKGGIKMIGYQDLETNYTHRHIHVDRGSWVYAEKGAIEMVGGGQGLSSHDYSVVLMKGLKATNTNTPVFARNSLLILDGSTLTGAKKGTNRAIYAENKSTYVYAQNSNISKFLDAAYSNNGAHININGSTVTDCITAAVANRKASVYAYSAKVTDTKNGFIAQHGSLIDCEAANINSEARGVAAYAGSEIIANNATINSVQCVTSHRLSYVEALRTNAKCTVKDGTNKFKYSHTKSNTPQQGGAIILYT